MTVCLQAVGRRLPAIRVDWEPRDCALFAVANGAGFADLPFVDPRHGSSMQVTPGFPFALVSALACQQSDPLLGAGDFRGRLQLLFSQSVELFQRTPAQGPAWLETGVEAIYDTGKAALVVLASEATCIQSSRKLFSARTVMHIAGEGGFGGERPPSALYERREVPPDAESLNLRVSDNQSLLYALVARDVHPIHFDHAAASSAGLDAPILAGHNVLAQVGHALASRLDGDMEFMSFLGARFLGPVFNGDALTVAYWTEHGETSADRVLRFQMARSAGEPVAIGKCQIGRNPV